MSSIRLDGKRVVITRPVNRSAVWIQAFSEEGAIIIHEPIYEMIGISGARLETVRQRLFGIHRGGTWIAFSSAETVRHFGTLVESPGKIQNVKWAAVGPATSSAMADIGIDSDLVGNGTGAEELASMILDRDPSPDLLHLTSDQGLRLLCDRIGESGGNAERLVLSIQRMLKAVKPEKWLYPEPPDLLTFASPGAVKGLLEATAEDHIQEVIRIPAVATGATTAGYLRERGWKRVGEGNHQIGSVIDTAVAVLLEDA